MSVDRAERTGTTVASVEWKMEKRRVIPPSTASSTTTSASLMPDCGLALGALSIFTTSAGRLAGWPGRPVSGCMGALGPVVVVVARVVDVVGGGLSSPPPHAAKDA